MLAIPICRSNNCLSNIKEGYHRPSFGAYFVHEWTYVLRRQEFRSVRGLGVTGAQVGPGNDMKGRVKVNIDDPEVFSTPEPETNTGLVQSIAAITTERS